MNIAKNMEAIFIAAVLVLGSLAYEPAVENTEIVLAQSTNVQTVVVTAKRG